MIPGFEEGIIGKSAGDEFTLDLTFPEEYHNDDLAGAAVQFAIKLNSVSEQKLPEVDEEFYKSFGVEEGGEEAFRKEVINNMQREMKTASRNKLKNAVMDSLIGMVDVTPPKALVHSEIHQLKHQMVQQMGGGRGMDPHQLPDEIFTEQAERRVILGLVLGEIIRQQNLHADPAKVRETVEELASTYESPEEVVKWYYNNEEQLNAIEQSVIEDQVFDYIIETAGIGEKQVSYQDVIKAEEPKASATADSEESAAETSSDD
jgi:trigger factor